MTGPIGARVNRAVALVTDDFALYHRLTPYLESHGIPVLGLRPGQAVPASVRVLLGGPATDPRSLPIPSDPEAGLLAIYWRLDPRPTARPRYRKAVAGVDPGETIGLALLADGEPMLVAESRAAEDAVARLGRWAGAVEAESWEFHVGDRHPKVGRALLALLWDQFPKAQVVVVPEAATTPWSPVTRSRHTDAAILIALREPKAVP